MSYTAAIMQPTYLPWIGYFDLIDQVDTFVLLDCVQFDKRSWQQRNRIKTADGIHWLTVPVISKGRRDQRIVDVEVDASRSFERLHLQSIQHSYARAAFFDRYIGTVRDVLSKGYRRLADLNADLIVTAAAAMGIETRIVRSSTLSAEGVKVSRLISICKAIGADRYLSPPGSRGYIEENDLFSEHGIELMYQAYEHPAYEQLHGPFVSHLSVVDLLLNEGERSAEIMRSGRCAPEMSGA